mgnify:CR=1 FL=1
MRCRFKHKIFQNEENGYTIAIFTTQDTSVPLSARDKYLASRNIIGFSAIGFGLPLTDEIELEMEGRWESGEHGTQYQVENFMEVVPRTKEGILGYLSSGAIKGIGPKMADTIFRKFGLQTLEIMENNPQELLKIRGISEKKLAAIVESYGKNQVFRELMTFLAPFKVTPKKVNMILKKFGNESVDIIRHRPYMLSAVKGFGFLTVDAIGRQCCCALNDPMRISGCIGHIMNQAMKEGHLFKQRQEVIREALEILNRDLQVMAVSEQDVSQVLYRLVLQKSIVVEEERIYSIRQYEEETQTASMIARRLLEKPVLLSIEPELEKAQKTLGITLSETQKQAVRMVFAHPISIITGGPGTGKTTVLKVILYIHQALCRSEVQLMSDLYLSNEMTILSLSVSSHPFPLSCVSTQSELLIRIISGMIYISSDLSVGISTIDDGMKLGIRLLLTILLSGNSDEDLANSSISTTFPFSLVYTPSFNMM